MQRLVLVTLCSCMLMLQYRLVQGHGHLLDPPSRSSMWREGFNTPRNYNDNQLNCGGYYNQWGLNRGKCGICGDPYQNPQPRDNESGGKYGKGVISRTYTAGQIVTFKVLITANHMGWFEFKLCPNGSPSTPVTQECLDKYLLPFADGSGARYDLGSRSNVISVDLKLPDGVVCQQCVIQWRWHAGNNYGVDDSGNKCIGCGPQEEFYGCADVAISSSGNNNNNNNPMTNSPVTQPLLTNAPFPPITFPTFAPITNAPVTNAPITFQPITMKPYTDTPRTFMPITFPFYTQPTAPPQTLAPNQPVATFPTNQPVVTSGPNQRPNGFIPISPAPAQNNNNFIPSGSIVNPTNLSPLTFRPVVTSQPQTTTQPPITFFRPPTTKTPQIVTVRPTNPPPVTFFRPRTTIRFNPVVLTLKPANPQVSFFTPPPTLPPQTASTARPTRPPVTFFRPATTPRPASTQRPTQPPITATTRPIIFNLGGRTNFPNTQQPMTSRPTLKPANTPSSTVKPTTTRSNLTNGKFCYGINSWTGDPQLDQWCNAKCNLLGGTCPPEFCECV